MASDLDSSKPGLSPASIILRLGAIGLVLLVALGAFAYTGGWLSPERLTQKKIVAGFEQASGPHPGFRRNHAKGLCALGTFESNGAAASVSKATLFATGRVPVVARLAFAGGLPFVADSPSLVRSLAIRFQPVGGEEWRTGMINIPVFPFSNAKDFYEQAQAVLPDPATGKVDPAKMGAFVAAHPGFAAAGGLIGKRVVSSNFADTTYNGLDTFHFIAADGTVTPVRWSTVAVDPFVAAPPAPAAGAPAPDSNALFDAFLTRAASRPVQWRLVVTLGQTDDPVSPAVPWPAERKQIDAGTVTLDRVVAEDNGPCTDVNFDPLILPDGIAPSADEIPSARSAAYSRSFRLREGERSEKPPSAVTPREVSAGGKS
jgi:catalase